MAKIEAHRTYGLNTCEDDKGMLAEIHPASDESVKTVLDADPDSMDGRSNWVWVRLPNGDLILGVYPQGDTYFQVERDAQYPGD